MTCTCRDEQFVNIDGQTVVLKNVSETFRYVQLIRGRDGHGADLGALLVSALREVGNRIPAEQEAEYGRMLSEMFAVYCAVQPRIGCD